MRAFCCSNSSSVSTPALLSSPSCCSWASLSVMSDGAATGGGGGGGAYCGGACCCSYCSCSYCCCSWSAHRPAWRRETRFDTAVAVPATTAVRATPRIRPGMSSSLLRPGRGRDRCLRLDGVERLQQQRRRNPRTGDEACSTPHERGG